MEANGESAAPISAPATVPVASIRSMDGIKELAPIRHLLDDLRISEVMINDYETVYVERRGQLVLTNVRFHDEAELVAMMQAVATAANRPLGPGDPVCDGMLPDGSRFHAVLPPVSVDGPSLSIRKFARTPLQVDDLVRFGSCTEEAFAFMRACVLAKANIVVSGGSNSGKTTFLNILSGFIPGSERIVTIEDAAELALRQENVVRTETQPPMAGRPGVTMRELVIGALRMRPDRIVVGECRGPEALDMLQAMNTGHDGSMTTIHANSPRDAIARIETMVLMAGFELPLWAVRRQMTSALNIIVQLERLPDGRRRVSRISEIVGIEGDTITMNDVFSTEGDSVDGRPVRLHVTGIRPRWLDKIAAKGMRVPRELQAIFPDKAGIAHVPPPLPTTPSQLGPATGGVQCAGAGCHNSVGWQCSYTDQGGKRCTTFWCADHVDIVGGRPFCHRHANVVRPMESLSGSVYESDVRPDIGDRSMSLAVHLAGEISAQVVQALGARFANNPEAQAMPDHRPRGVFAHRSELVAWEMGWTAFDSSGFLSRVALRVGLGEPALIQAVVDEEVLYEATVATADDRSRLPGVLLGVINEGLSPVASA